MPPLPDPYTLRWRMGAAVPDGRSPVPLAWPSDRPGWYLNWSVGYTDTVWSAAATDALSTTSDLADSELAPEIIDELAGMIDFAVPNDARVGMAFVPLVWVDGADLFPSPTWLAATVQRLPGRTWLIGNEPDVKWQGNATPADYAQAYHLAYTTIKAADPTAQVAIGGLSQITPLRLAYLDAVWEAYRTRYGEAMPVDVWNMHAFVLRERLDDWGVDIPPGIDPDLAAELGMVWEIEQHDDLTLVEAQIRRMRTWMHEHDQQDKPLWITEYGVLMPAEYGFDSERVRRFMLGSFDRFLTLRDAELGFGPDDDRLVQRWMWFSTDDALYPTGNLFALTGEPTDLLAAMTAYLAEFGEVNRSVQP